MKKYVIAVVFTMISGALFAQIGDYRNFYPIGESPSVRTLTAMARSKEIPLLDIQPIARFSFFNTIKSSLVNADRIHGQAWYVSFLPQMRSFLPGEDAAIDYPGAYGLAAIRMPSYKILLGTQHIFRLTKPDNSKQRLIAFAIESGHFSNGQNGCAFREGVTSQSVDCFKAYEQIDDKTRLYDVLNRVDGKFSTNMSRWMLNYRRYDLGADALIPRRMHSFQLGYTRFHNKVFGLFDFGGFPQRKDALLYGLNRFNASYEYQFAYSKDGLRRISLEQRLEYIKGGHKSIEPIRSESIVTWYPFSKVRALGLFAGYVIGHDNYNIRFVDFGNSGSIGFKWSQFPALQLANSQRK